MHSSFLLALPLAHLGTARYLPWGNSRSTLARRELPAVQVVPMAESSMSMSMTAGHPMPMGTGAPLVQLATPSSVASAILISMVPLSSAAPKASASIASVAAPSASSAAAFTPKAPSASIGSVVVPSASAASVAAFSSAMASPSASLAAASPKAPLSSASAFVPKASAAPSSASAAPSSASVAVPKASPASSFSAAAAPSTAPSTGNTPSSPAAPANPAIEAGISSGLQLNILTLEAELAAATDLLEQAQKGNPLNKSVYNVGKENLKALQVAGVKIRVNNMELAKMNPKVLRTLTALQAEQAREAELSSKLTGDATGDLSVLLQLQRALASGVQKQSNFKVDELTGGTDPSSSPSPFDNAESATPVPGAQEGSFTS